MLYLMVLSFLFKTSELANDASAVHFVIYGRQFKAFLDANEALPANGGPCDGRIGLWYVLLTKVNSKEIFSNKLDL